MSSQTTTTNTVAAVAATTPSPSPSQLRILPQTDNVRGIQTILHDKNTSNTDFEFHANRLIRLVVEEGLDLVPVHEKTITTPTGCEFVGAESRQGLCGVTVMRAGEAMERGLRECLKAIHIGHILIQRDTLSPEPIVYYAKFPEDVKHRLVLLLNPVIGSGSTLCKAVQVLLDFGVSEDRIVVLNLFAATNGISVVLARFPKLRIVSSEVREQCCSMSFSDRYFGT